MRLLSKHTSWLGLIIVCAGTMVVLVDGTIVTVALPSIAGDLKISETDLTWILNAYTLSFAGFILLAGRLGDLYGPRRLFLTGISMFTLTSLACGLAYSETTLVLARAAQGLSGAAVTAVSLVIIINLFPLPAQRARAIAIHGFVSTAGTVLGQALGGFVSQLLSWHWIFFINLPIGAGVSFLCTILLPKDNPPSKQHSLDISGAALIATISSLTLYGFTQSIKSGWISFQTGGTLCLSTILLLLLLAIERRTPQPILPLSVFRLRGFATTTLVGLAWTAGSSSWSVIAVLYLQRVLGYDPLHVGLAFAPMTAMGAALSLVFSAKVVTRFGARKPLFIGLLLSAMGTALFARVPLAGTFLVDILPAMALLTIGSAMAAVSLPLTAMSEISVEERGLGSGLITLSFLMGAALGIAILGSLADMRTSELRRSGASLIVALDGGYRLASLTGALLIALAAILSGLMLRSAPTRYLADSTAT